MSTAPSTRRVTPQDLLEMPDGDLFELVDGRLVERDMGFKSGRIGGNLFFRLKEHVDARKLGWALPADVGYQCFADDPDRVRKPDVSFIDASRLGPKDEPAGHCRIAPDLAVEVTSPNDRFQDVQAKVDEYLEAGVRLVWVIESHTGRALIYRLAGHGTILSMNDELDGEDVVRGFRCKIADLFQAPHA